MNSLGINPIITIYNLNYIDSFFNLFMSDIKKKYPNIGFCTYRILDNDKEKINNLTFTTTKEKLSELKKYILKSDYKQECIDLMNIEFKTEEEKSLTDFKHTIKTPTNFYILRFDFIY